MYYPNPEETLRKQEEFRRRIENQRKYGVTSYKNDTNRMQIRSSATYKITKDLTHLHAQVRGTGRCVRGKDGSKIETTKTINEEIQKLFVKYRMTSQENVGKNEDVTDRVSIVLQINVNRSKFDKITQKELTVDETKMVKKSKTIKAKNNRNNNKNNNKKPAPAGKEDIFNKMKPLQNKVVLKIIPDSSEIKNDKIQKMKIIGKIHTIKSKRISEILSEENDEPIEALVLEFVGEEDKKDFENNVCAVKNDIPSLTSEDQVDANVQLNKTFASRAASYIGEVFQNTKIQHYSVTAVVCGGMLIGAYHADDVLAFIKTSGLAFGAEDDSELDGGLWSLVPKF